MAVSVRLFCHALYLCISQTTRQNCTCWFSIFCRYANFGVKENSILKGVLRGLKGQKLSSKYTLYYKSEFSYLRFFAPHALLYCSADYNETLVSCTH